MVKPKLKLDELVEREGLYYKKYTDVPFSGDVDDGLDRGSFKNGKMEGLWVQYWRDGEVLSKCHYKNGERDGLWVEYHENGQLRWKGEIKDGEREGPWESFDEDGTRDSEGSGTYKNGVKVK